MEHQEIFSKIIEPAFEQAAMTVPHFKSIQPEMETEIYGTEKAQLDSIGLISFIFVLENVLESVTGQEIKFSTDEIIDTQTNYFSTVQSLIGLIEKKLNDI